VGLGRLSVGDYQQRFGDVPQGILLQVVRAESLDREGLEMVTTGMQNLVSALAEARGFKDELTDERRH
jgi:hypothetical protein